MSNLQELIEDFDAITAIAYDLSQQFDGVDTTDRKRKASTYYLAKIVPECISLLRIIPGSRFTDSDEILDFPTLCSISRNLIEATNLHWYYCIEETTDEVSNFRFSLYDYHDYRATIRIGELFNSGGEDGMEKLRIKCEKLKELIKINPIFQPLPPEVQRQILKGRKCAEYNQTEICKKRNLDIDNFNGIYKILSSNTHSMPFAINAIVHTRIHGQELQEALSVLILSYVASFVSYMVKTIGDIWDIEYAKKESKDIIYSYAGGLFESSK